MAVVEKSWPYSTGPGSFVTQVEWNELIRAFTSPGVVSKVLNEYAYTVTGALQVQLNTGEALAEGSVHRLEGGQKTFNADAHHATQPRKDRLVVRCNRDTGRGDITYLKGVAQAVPVPPAITQTPDGTGIYDIPLYILNIPATAGQMTITDERQYALSPAVNLSTTAMRPTAVNAGPRILWITTDDGVLAYSDGLTWTALNTRNVLIGGVLLGNRTGLNLIAGSGLSLVGADNPGAARVDVTVSSIERFFFGDGMDDTNGGVSVFDPGTQRNTLTIAGTTTLIGDIYCQNLVVTGTLVTAGYRVFVVDTLTLGPGALIKNDGLPATGTVAGVGAPAGTIGGGTNGAAGSSNGAASNPSIGGSGGNGQTGLGGVITRPTTANGGGQIAHDLVSIIRGRDLGNNLLKGGSGGGGGGLNGGGGGGGAGLVLIFAQWITVTSGTAVISARGGNGDVASGLGGGGGGGGFVLVVSRRPISYATWPPGLQLLAPGGNPGVNGQAGVQGPTLFVSPGWTYAT